MHEERELTLEVANALADARLFHMFVPRSLGGREVPHPEYLPVGRGARARRREHRLVREPGGGCS